MALTTQDKLGIANLGFQGLSGLFAGADNSDEEARLQAEQNQLFQLLLAQLGNNSNIEADINDDQLRRAQAFTSANPLGAENDYRKRNSLGFAGLDVLSNRRLAGGVPNMAAGFSSRPDVRAAYDPSNVDEAIRQRRIATAGLDPRAQQEIGGAGSDYASRLFGELQDNQNSRRQAGSHAMDLINQQRAQLAQQQQEENDGGGFWKKLGGALLPVAGIAANFIPGVGPLAGALISGAAGAAGGGLAGGRRGAALGAGLGVGGSLGANWLENRMQGSQPQFNNQMTSASLPTSMQNAAVPGAGQLMLPGTPNSAMSQYAQPQRPAIQQALAQSPTAPSAPNYMAGFPTLGMSRGNPNPYYNAPTQSAGLTTPQPRTQLNNQMDLGRFSDAKIGGPGAPINQQASQNFGQVAGPAMNTSALAALLMALQGAGPAGAAAGTTLTPAVQRLLGSPQGQALLKGFTNQRALPPVPRALGTRAPSGLWGGVR